MFHTRPDTWAIYHDHMWEKYFDVDWLSGADVNGLLDCFIFGSFIFNLHSLLCQPYVRFVKYMCSTGALWYNTC